MVEPRLDAVAVELDLVNPIRALRRSSVQGGEAWRNEVGQPAAASGRAHRLDAALCRNRHRRLCGRFSFRARLGGGLASGGLALTGSFEALRLRLQLGAKFTLGLRPRVGRAPLGAAV